MLLKNRPSADFDERKFDEASSEPFNRPHGSALGTGKPPCLAGGGGGHSERARGNRTDAGHFRAPPLARYLPQQDLAAYLEFEGLDAHGAAWHKSTAYKLLNDTSLGTLLEDLATQAIAQAQQSAREDKRVAAADYLNVLKHAARDGLAVGVFGKGPDNTHVVVVVRKGNRPEVVRLLDTLAAAGPGQPEQKPEPAQKNGRALHALATEGVWWVEQDDLILTDEASFDRIVKVIDGKQPSAASHPLRGLDPVEGRL